MPVARIVTPLVNKKSQALKKLSERLQAAGYEVDVVGPDTPAREADLMVEVGELPTDVALETALDLGRRDDADVLVAPGLFTEANHRANSEQRLTVERPEDDVVASVMELCASESRPVEEERELSDASVLAGSDEGEPAMAAASSHEEQQQSSDAEQSHGAAIQEGSSGIRDALAGVYGRVAETLSELQQRRSETMQAMREERERREVEREQQRREREIELQRQAEEKQRLVEERELQAAERARELREQRAREAAVRAEQERVEREAIAREAARRAQEAQAAEQERHRLAAIEAERVRAAREQEEQRAAAMAAELARRDQARQRAAASAAEITTVSRASKPVRQTPSRTSPVPAMPPREPLPRPRLVPRPHRRPTTRERQWQHAAFVASIATLAAMMGIAIATHRNPVSPLPQALKQSEVQQQVPFGPARINLSSTKVPRVSTQSLSPGLESLPARRTGELGGTSVGSLSARSSSSPKPSAARANSKRAASRSRVSSEDDEVIVRHLRTQPTQRATQTSASGIRHYSDQN